MYARDYRDLIGGGLLILIGAAVTLHATNSLGLGTLLRLGSGGFPAALGVLLVVFGLALIVPAFRRRGELLPIAILPLICVLASILAFAVTLRTLGIVPAVIVMTLIATRADSKLSLFKAGILAVVLATFATLIFPIGLGIRVPILTWNW
jgi:hypothetical protein